MHGGFLQQSVTYVCVMKFRIYIFLNVTNIHSYNLGSHNHPNIIGSVCVCVGY
jgi:hypothetical protein